MEKNKKYYSDLQESLISAYLGWKQTSGSGSRPLYPGDVVSDEWLGECKTHTTPGHPIIFDFNVWNKIQEEAASQYKQAVLFVDDGSQTFENTYCMIDVSNQLDCLASSKDDYTGKSSARFKPEELPEITIIQKDKKVYCIMKLAFFSSFIGLE